LFSYALFSGNNKEKQHDKKFAYASGRPVTGEGAKTPKISSSPGKCVARSLKILDIV